LQVLQAWATCTRPLLFLEHTKYSLATEPFNLPGWTSNNFMVQSLIFSGYCLCVSLSEKSSLLSYIKCAIVLISFWCLLTAFKPYSFSFPFCLTHWQAKSLMLPSLIPVGNSNLM
jgi:hypothetical protein